MPAREHMLAAACRQLLRHSLLACPLVDRAVFETLYHDQVGFLNMVAGTRSPGMASGMRSAKVIPEPPEPLATPARVPSRSRPSGHPIPIQQSRQYPLPARPEPLILILLVRCAPDASPDPLARSLTH